MFKIRQNIELYTFKNLSELQGEYSHYSQTSEN